MMVVPRVTIASIIATYVGGLLNVHIFAKIKKNTGNGKLWLRTFVSTFVGLVTNAVLFTLLAFAGTKSVAQMSQMVLISVVVRLAAGVLELIFLYFMTFLREKGFILRDNTPISVGPTPGKQEMSA